MHARPDRRLSKRERLRDDLGRDPGEVIYELVYRQSKTLRAAGQRLGVHESTAQRWMRDWQRRARPIEPEAMAS